MQQAVQYTTNVGISESVLTIPRAVYNALHPLDQVAAQALERIGKVRILDEEES